MSANNRLPIHLELKILFQGFCIQVSRHVCSISPEIRVKKAFFYYCSGFSIPFFFKTVNHVCMYVYVKDVTVISAEIDKLT